MHTVAHRLYYHYCYWVSIYPAAYLHCTTPSSTVGNAVNSIQLTVKNLVIISLFHRVSITLGVTAFNAHHRFNMIMIIVEIWICGWMFQLACEFHCTFHPVVCCNLYTKPGKYFISIRVEYKSQGDSIMNEISKDTWSIKIMSSKSFNEMVLFLLSSVSESMRRVIRTDGKGLLMTVGGRNWGLISTKSLSDNAGLFQWSEETLKLQQVHFYWCESQPLFVHSPWGRGWSSHRSAAWGWIENYELDNCQ